MNHVPLVGGQWFIDINIGEEAEGEYKDTEVNPCKEKHEYCEPGEDLMLFYVSFKVESAPCHKNIASIVNDQDHDPSSNLVAHHRK